MGMVMEADPNTPPSPDDAHKACADCHTTKTPLWRGGPEGPKSLCNACGIRYRKRRRQALGLAAAPHQDQPTNDKADDHQLQEVQPPKKGAADPQEDRQPRKKAADPQEDQQQQQPKKTAADPQEDQQQPKKKKKAPAPAASSTNKKERRKKDRQVTVELRVVGFGKEVMLKQRRQMRRNKCMSEEERAAVLLMAMSSGVIYAS